ncbi:MAG: SpoIIE family protein phosphatase [Acidobacteria bacterium]|nr:SpoIIE family protein phosphatase [Acidobacteriota bacterium]
MSPSDQNGASPASGPQRAEGKDLAAMLEATFECVADGVVVVDTEGRFLFFNGAARTILGLGALDTAPEDWSSACGCFRCDRVTPYPSEELPLARALRGQRAEDEFFVRNPHIPEGATIHVRGTPLTNGDGSQVGAAVIFQDVTQRRLAEQTVRRLAQAVEQATDSVVITDAQARIEYVNPAFEQTTGYSKDEAVGRPVTFLQATGSPDPGSPEPGRARFALDDGPHTSFQRRRTGELFPARRTTTPVRDEHGRLTHFVSVMSDVTGQRRAQARESEMQLARLIQRKLYPSRAPALKAFDLAGAVFPADATCGDYLDYIPMGGGRVGVAVGDVSGHGFGPALLMAETRAYLRSLAKTTHDLRKILQRLNQFLHRDTELERFVTLMLVVVDPSRRSLTYGSAGHVPGFLLDRSGAPRRVLESTSLPLGIFPDSPMEVSPEISLEDGDLFVLLTDGVTEAENERGEFFERDRAVDLVARMRWQSSRRIVSGLYRAIEDFRLPGPQADDVTAVVGKALPTH